MKFHYYPETDSLYIDLTEKPGTDSEEIRPGVVLDFDAEGHLVGIDIDRASKVVNPAGDEAIEPCIGHSRCPTQAGRAAAADGSGGGRRDGGPGHRHLRLSRR